MKTPRIPTYVKNNDGVKVPVFIKLSSTEMRYIKHNDTYYRDGGVWEVNYIIKDGKLFSNCETLGEHLHDLPLERITKKEWAKANKGYVPSNEKIAVDLGILKIDKVCECCGQIIKNKS